MSDETQSATEPEEAPASVSSDGGPSTEGDAPQSSPDTGAEAADGVQAGAEESPREQPGPTAPAANDQPGPSAPEAAPERQAFRFNVDRTPVDVPGAYVDGGNVVMPQDAWNRVVAPRLADRPAIQRRENEYRSEIQRLTQLSSPEANPDVQQARALTQAIQEGLLNPDLSDEQVLEARWQLMANLPVLQERAKAEAANFRLQGIESQQQAAYAQQIVEGSVPHLRGALETYVTTAVQHPDLQAYGLDPQEILNLLLPNGGTAEDLDELWQDTADYDPSNTVRLPFQVQGKTLLARLDVGRIDRYLHAAKMAGSRVSAAAERRAQETSARTAQAAQVAKQNAAAVTPSAAPPVVAAQGSPAGAEAGKPWEALRKQAAAARRGGEYGKADELMEEARVLHDRHMKKMSGF